MEDLSAVPSGELIDLLDRLAADPQVPASIKVRSSARIMAMHARIADLEEAVRAARLQVENILFAVEQGDVHVAEHVRAWRNVLETLKR